MPTRRRIMEWVLILAGVGLWGVGIYWGWSGVTALAGRTSGWLFPSGWADMRALVIWGYCYGMAFLLAYACAFVAPGVVLLGATRLLYWYRGWPWPATPRQPGVYY